MFGFMETKLEAYMKGNGTKFGFFFLNFGHRKEDFEVSIYMIPIVSLS